MGVINEDTGFEAMAHKHICGSFAWRVKLLRLRAVLLVQGCYFRLKPQPRTADPKPQALNPEP